MKDLGNLRENFEKCLEAHNCVNVETFYEKLKNDNSLFSWSDKIKNPEKFIEFMKSNTDHLEVLAEGFRCLCQIHINLICDFDIYKDYPIRKYSSAFNYISKVDGFRDLLKEIGYVEGDMRFVLSVTKLADVEAATATALDLLICFMEIMELYYLKSNGSGSIAMLITERETIIESKAVENVPRDEIKKKFQKCELCTSEINEKGVCTVCGSNVTEFSFSWLYHQFIKDTYDLDVPKKKKTISNDQPKPNILAVVKKPAFEAPVNKPNAGNGGKWACGSCTYMNDHSALNCEICGSGK